MTSSQFGPWPTLHSLRDVRATTPSSLMLLLTPGDVMTATTGSEAWAKMGDYVSGTLVLACCTDLEQ